MSRSNPTGNGERGSRHAPPTNPFPKGNKMGGMRPMDPELRAALIADTPARYERLKALSLKAENDGDIKTAVTVELALLRKTVPDTNVMLLGDTDGKPMRVIHIDPKRLTTAQVQALVEVQKAQAKGE